MKHERTELTAKQTDQQIKHYQSADVRHSNSCS